MSAMLRWRQSWTTSGPNPYLNYGEGWADSWQLGSGEIAAVGHTTVAGALVYGLSIDIGSGSMDMVGHATTQSSGFSYPTEFVPSLSGQIDSVGHLGVSGAIDFEEPFFVDPPLRLTMAGHLAPTATITYKINWPLLSPTIPSMKGHVALSNVGLQYQITVTKQLFSVALAATGRTTVSGVVSSTTVKAIGAGLMAMSGRSSISQSGFQIEAPAPYTHPLGSGNMPLVGFVETIGDPLWTDQPPFDLGSVTLVMNGHQAVGTERLFAGGIFNIESLLLVLSGRTILRSAFSYPGFDFASTEIVAVYEGLYTQESFADLEGDAITIVQ